MKSASNGQFRELIGKLLVKGNDEKITKIHDEKIQPIINFLSSKDESDRYFENFIRFINNGFNLQIIGNHEIDTNGTPSLPFNGATIEHHEKSGKMILDFSKVSLYLSEKQKNGSIMGNDLRKELKNKNVLNACVLDYLLANPHLIPEDWKGKAVFFWGTIFRFADGSLCVRFLVWELGEWRSYCALLDDDFVSSSYAIVSAS